MKAKFDVKFQDKDKYILELEDQVFLLRIILNVKNYRSAGMMPSFAN